MNVNFTSCGKHENEEKSHLAIPSTNKIYTENHQHTLNLAGPLPVKQVFKCLPTNTQGTKPDIAFHSDKSKVSYILIIIVHWNEWDFHRTVKKMISKRKTECAKPLLFNRAGKF